MISSPTSRRNGTKSRISTGSGNSSHKNGNNNTSGGGTSGSSHFGGGNNGLPPITSPGVRRLTIFPEELVAPMMGSNAGARNFSGGGMKNGGNCCMVANNYNDVISGVIGANPATFNNIAGNGYAGVGGGNGMCGPTGPLMDFVVPHPCDPPFVSPATMCWRPNGNNSLMQPMGGGGCDGYYNHLGMLHHHQIHHNSGIYPTHAAAMPPTMAPPSFMGGGMPYVGNGGGDSNHYSPPSLFNGSKGSGSRGSPFANSTSSAFHNYGSGCGDGMFRMSHKIYIPHHSSYNFIGRILGPRGNSVRRLEALTGCKILIRGKGSIKDANRELRMRNMPGWEHLNEELHVLITAEDVNEHMCQLKLRRAAISIQRLLTPQFDEYKRQQLIQLAIINGTYRP